MATKNTRLQPKDEAFGHYLSIETETMTMRGLLAGAEALIEANHDRNHVHVLINLAQERLEEIWRLTQQMEFSYLGLLKEQAEKTSVSV